MQTTRNENITVDVIPDQTAFRGTLILPDAMLSDGIVLVENGRIAAAKPAPDMPLPSDAQVIDAADGYICPGFIDIPTHGEAGADHMGVTAEAD